MKRIVQNRKEQKRKLNQQQQFFLIIILSMLVLWIVMLLSIFNIEHENTRRFRMENYDRFGVNLQIFEKAMCESEGFVRNISTSISVLGEMEASTAQEIFSKKLNPGFTIEKDTFIFELNTAPHKHFSRLLGMIMASGSYSELVQYFPKSDVYIALTQNGYYAAACRGRDELRMIVDLQGEFIDCDDKAIVLAEPTKYATSPLYIVRRVGESYLLCGLSREEVDNTLLFDNSGRSYQLIQMACILDDGQKIFRTGKAMPGGAETLSRTDAIEVMDTYTVMRFRMEEQSLTMIACLQETGSTSALSSTWFRLLILLNVIWVLSLAVTYRYSVTRIFNPLQKISNEVSAQEMHIEPQISLNELERIANTIHHYHQQLYASQKTIEEQMRQLRSACLKMLVSGQYPSLTKEQIDELGISQLLSRYLLITIYPENGRWSGEACSEQENHAVPAEVFDTLSRQLEGYLVQYLMYQSCLLTVVPVPDEEAENYVLQHVQQWSLLISAQLSVNIRSGISEVHSGMDSFRRAYYEAIWHATSIEQQETSRAQENRLNMLLKQSMHMADLIYMERYSDACACFKEMIETLFQQKGRYLRDQQLSGLLQLTMSMVVETDGFKQLVQLGVDISELCSIDEKEKVLERWENMFSQLESHQIEQIHEQYSDQFAAVYQYMLTHFRELNFSLSVLADEFGMSISTLSRDFQKNLGQNFLESLHRMRIEAACYEIEHTAAPLSDIAVSVGYTNTLTMTRAFKKYLDCTPSTFRKKDAAH